MDGVAWRGSGAWVVLVVLAAALLVWGCRQEAIMAQEPGEGGAGVLRLELRGLSPEVRVGTPLRVEACFRASAPVVVFHRILMGWAPDELELEFAGATGVVRSPRVLLTTPKKILARREDFVAVTPERPLCFEFPTWTAEPLGPGSWTVRARYVAVTDAWVDAEGREHRVEVHQGVVESEGVVFQILP